VFFEWKYHTSGFLGRETHEAAVRVGFPARVGFPGQENQLCDISTQKTRVPFSVYHMTLNESILRHF
jgi:hypothetical protein